ncbi:MAG: LamG domain-containing protein [Phycisphaerae bacterium]|nr:LamG domain-containing protein [Phycisphaerae bacterium]
MRGDLKARGFGRGPCLAVIVWAAMLMLGPGVSAKPIWCSPFETEQGEAVSQDQIAEVVDNAVGAAGLATGSVTSLPALLYVKHGLYAGLIPSTIDPGGQAASFALSTPDDRRTGINTNLRSDAGNLGSSLTFEGYFYMPNADPVTSPTYIARRLVTQKRSADDGQSRLAIGVHAARVGVVAGLFDYEGFDYAGTTLVGQAGGKGWAQAWVTSGTTAAATLSDDLTSLDSGAFPYDPAGARVSVKSGAAARQLSRSLDLTTEGEVMYVSTLMRKTSTAATSADNLEITLGNSTTNQTIRIGMTSGDAFFLNQAANATGAVVAGDTYFVIAKIVSHAATADECYMSIYGPTDTTPTTEPTTWMLTNTLSGTVMLSYLRIVSGANLDKGEIDEIRVGSTYASVTDPLAPDGDPGEDKNLLATYWAESDGTATGVINHIEYGTTPLEANRWYHFAVTYDSTALRWYLDGNQEGEVLSPSVVGVGTGKIVLANNRSTAATNDRGFYGLLDEIRIWDKVLATDQMLVKGGGTGSGLLWRSTFETSKGQPVTDGQAAETMNCIDNLVGPPNGTPAGVLASFYTAFGQTGVPAVPATIDPAQLTSSFVLSLPDLPNVAVNTNVPSDTGNVANAVTIQGYFNTFRTTPVTASHVGSRLVSMMRSASEGQSRLAIGLAANDDAAPTHNVLSVAWADTSGVVTPVRGTAQIQPNTWYHFALVYDGTDIRWYLDGQLQGEVLAPALASPGSAAIVIGNDRTTGTGGRGFYGLLDKIVVSDHAIAPADFMTVGLDPCLGKWCNRPFADMDDDGDVDQIDFSQYQLCFAEVLVEGNPCLCLDKTGDNKVDATDLAEFAKCVTGPAVSWNSDLTPDCSP